MKKGMALSTVVIMLILAVVFILIVITFLLPEGLLNKAAEKSGVILTYLPSQGDLEPRIQEEVGIEIESNFNHLVSVFNNHKNKPGSCFIEYNPQPLGENKIKFLSAPAENKLIIKLIDKKGLDVLREEIDGLRPCVVAGVYEFPNKDRVAIAQNFYDNYLKEDAPRKRNNLPDFLEVPELFLTGDEKIVWGDKESDREDGGLLYVPEKGRICFFPTFGRDRVWGCNGIKEGLDNDCFDDKDNDVIFSLKKC